MQGELIGPTRYPLRTVGEDESGPTDKTYTHMWIAKNISSDAPELAALRSTPRRESRSNGQVSFHRGVGARVIHWSGPVEGKGPSESLIEIAKRLFSVFTPLLSHKTKTGGCG